MQPRSIPSFTSSWGLRLCFFRRQLRPLPPFGKALPRPYVYDPPHRTDSDHPVFRAGSKRIRDAMRLAGGRRG